MKHHIINYRLPVHLILILTALLVIGCDKQTDNSGFVFVMKFKQPEYKDNVLAYYFFGGDSLYGISDNRCEDPIGKTKSYPYWELPNGWLLVDWKWMNLPYLDFGGAEKVLLTNQTWDEFKGYSANNANIPTWPLSEPHIMEPLEDFFCILPNKLEKYCQSTYGEKMKENIYTTQFCINDSTDSSGKCLCEIADTMDSIWTILQRDLSVAIENGVLERVSRRYNPYPN